MTLARSIGERAVFAHELDRNASRRGGGLQVVMKIEVVAVRSREPGRPALRNVDEDNVERVAAGLQR